MSVRISVAIIAFNEEQNIADAVRSACWADEVLVVDSESTDRTREIAADAGAKVLTEPWRGFSAQKQFATDTCSNDWVLSLDADERVSDKLRDEILGRAGEGILTGFDGYRIPRLTSYMGREIRHGGWYPDRQLRLFDRRRGAWNGRLIHESFVLDSEARKSDLRNDLLHATVKSPLEHHRMIGERYAPLAAEQMFVSGRKTNALTIAIAGPAAFFRTYFLKLGFLDGLPGYVIARMSAHHAFLKHILLYRKQRDRDTR